MRLFLLTDCVFFYFLPHNERKKIAKKFEKVLQIQKKFLILQYQTKTTTTMKANEITMRHILKALTREMGETEGKDIFEWYCRTYDVTVADAAPATVRWEVLGI